ncbi:hypothetical protein AAHA92_20037 [Salvia divinorum]|uniref:Uncharacterized protein n=1 Tax=Salvia divinorum TaxID=28513 RepID=A0ABD1GIZ6_SALDI
MVSKRNVSIVLLLAIVLLISSEVADAREMAETFKRVASKKLQERDRDGFECANGCCGFLQTPQMVSTRVQIRGLLLFMALLISSQVADARNLNRVPPKEGDKMMGSYVLPSSGNCPNRGCCGTRLGGRGGGGGPGYCRCCPYPDTHLPTDPHT